MQVAVAAVSSLVVPPSVPTVPEGVFYTAVHAMAGRNFPQLFW